jgi:hypothetical protein
MLSSTIMTVRAQTPDNFSIHVESNQVLVPTYVFYKDRMKGGISKAEGDCVDANDATFRKLWPGEAFIPSDCNDTAIRGLVAKDFHVLEDGVEQKVQNVTFEVIPQLDARDNFGDHIEQSETPAGKWSTVETRAFIHGATVSSYRIAYMPPESPEGSCHRVEVKVDRSDAFVYSRSQYCNLKHAPEDPLNGTPFGKQLEGNVTSGKRAKIEMSIQAGFFYTSANNGRVELVLDFPWNLLKREWRDGSLYATIGVLGLLYRKDGTLASRFSDFGCCSQDQPDFIRSPFHMDAAPFMDNLAIPTRYERQVADLPAGEYSLHLILGDGSKFGRADVPLNIESYDSKQLALSSVVLCKRFRNASVAAQEAASFNLAPQYVPLVSKGVQFTPTGDMTFRKGEPLFAYFEVYEPLLATAPAATVKTELKLTDVKTGEVKVDTGPRSAADWIEPGKSAIRIAEQIAVDKLPKGSYRLAVQATDSAGRSTVWRTADFTVE